MDRLDQGHLHPKLGPETDMSRRGIKPRIPQGEANTLAKSYSNSMLLVIRGRLFMIPRHGFHAVHVVT
jgi:hypothetical protein